MHDTRFGDVELSVGAHYLYCHQGDCEHIVIVTDVRQVTSSDPGNWFSYPVHTYQATVEHRMCSVCLVEVAACVLQLVPCMKSALQPCVACISQVHLLRRPQRLHKPGCLL